MDLNYYEISLLISECQSFLFSNNFGYILNIDNKIL